MATGREQRRRGTPFATLLAGAALALALGGCGQSETALVARHRRAPRPSIWRPRT